MSYDASKVASGREPFQIVELDLDKCFKVFSQECVNSVIYSEEFDNAAWIKSSATISANTNLAPNGLYVADKITESAGIAEHRVGQASVVSSGSVYGTVFIKAAERTKAWLRIFNATDGEVANSVFDIKGGEIFSTGAGSAKIERIALGYYRINVSGTSTVANSELYIQLADDAGATTYNGDGVSGAYIFGAQISNTDGHYTKTTTVAANSKCLASGVACYNTRSTCKDTANYTKSLKSYRFCSAGARLPISYDLIPCVEKISLRSPEINPVESIGVRGSATVTFNDFPHHDRGIDPYADARSYMPEDQGTFFGKLKARNPFYVGRSARVYTGFYTDPFDTDNFLAHEYQIESISGIDSSGKVTIKAKDPLKLTQKEKATCPIANSGVLLAAITGTPATFTLTPTGVGNDEYDASGYVRIEDEIIQFARSADVMTVVSRATWGSVSADHAIDEKVQQCKSWSATNVVDILDDLIRDFTDINPNFIDDTGWAAQKAGFLSTQSLTNILSEPVGVDKLLNELITDNLFDLWWDDRSSLIKIRSFIPYNVNSPPAPLGDRYHFVKGKTKQADRQDKLITQVRVIYEPRNYTEASDEKDFRYAYIAANTDSEGVDQYNEKRIKTITTSWFSAANRGIAISLASRLLQRYNRAPIELTFSLDVKDDDLAIADNFRTDTKANQDVDGSNKDVWMQVISVQEDQKNSLVKYKALSLELIGRYGFIAPDSVPDYGSATDQQKADYAWVCLNTGLFSTGEDGYAII